MTKFKLQDLLLSDKDQFAANPAMLVKSNCRFHSVSDDEWELDGPGEHDFTTYFNALSVHKWRKYTVANNFFVHLEVCGSACTVIQTDTNPLSYYPIESSDVRASLPQSNDWQSVDLHLDSDNDILTGFKIRCEGPIRIRNVHYLTEVDDSCIRDVNLALCTTTFRKEEFIRRNMTLVANEILTSNEPIANRFTMHVVDNGRTLDPDEAPSPAIVIHPNDNVGGAGGFARGMLEAMRQKPTATHVLLMDDDVLVSTESIKRTFNLLRLVNDDYAEAFVSGAMMSLDDPCLRWEEMGFMGEDGFCHPMKPAIRVDSLHSIVANESFDPQRDIADETGKEQTYGAWWYCAIPVPVIRKNGMPLPIFVRYDDVEYGLRCKPKWMTMNSICIWHAPFNMRYNAAQERYQTVRNSMINQLTTGMAPSSDFLSCFKGAVRQELWKFNYTNAELALKGFEDFLKGPDWIMGNVAQEAFMTANREAEKLVPLTDLYDEADGLGVNLRGITDWQVLRDEPLSLKQRAELRLTMNYQKGRKTSPTPGKVVLVDNVGGNVPRGLLRGADVVISIDIENSKGVIRHKDIDRFEKVWRRFNKDLKEYKRREKELRDAYCKARTTITSVKFWDSYLGL